LNAAPPNAPSTTRRKADSDGPGSDVVLQPDFDGAGGALHVPPLHVFPFAQHAPPQQNCSSATQPWPSPVGSQQMNPGPTHAAPQHCSPWLVLQPWP
jgi:hypothetical protein